MGASTRLARSPLSGCAHPPAELFMPKAERRKYYAVRNGREGPRIYETWEECKLNVSRFPAAVHKSFTSRDSAEAWIREAGLTLGGDSPDTTSYTAQHVQPKPFQSRASPTVAPDPPPQALCPLPTASNTSAEAEIKLSPEQQQVLNKVKAGDSVFFTGSAGTGKSVLLREIIRYCRENGRQVAVTASTGIAAVNIGGSTVHSWAGIGLGKESKESLAGKILGQDKWKRMKDAERRREQGLPSEDEYEGDEAGQPRVVQRWRNVQTLIIDEISMIDGRLFDKLEYVARVLRRSSKPFGGIQLVLSGDFCQLPPVPDNGKGGISIPATFAFDAETWGACVGKPVCLKKVFRQKDPVFVDVLNSMRFGQLTPGQVQALKALDREVPYADGIEPTELFPTRHEVNRANSRRLAELTTPLREYRALDIPGWDDSGHPIRADVAKKLLERLVAEEVVTLKEGAQVMLIKNLVQGHLVNGSMGKVKGFLTTRDAVQRGIKIGVAEVAQKPPSPGVLGGKRVRPGPGEANTIPERVLRSQQLWPVVRFKPNGGYPETEVLCVPSQFEVNNADGGVEATREQVPLILAWALSIHKSQGQTLERVRVDLQRIFEKGQAYVALSRATSMKTLEVRHFDPAKVMAHERVLEWTRANTSLHVPLLPQRDEIDDELDFWED